MRNVINNFIVFEGIDGSGKSTIFNEIKKMETPILFLKEPGDTCVGTFIKACLKSQDDFFRKDSINLSAGLIALFEKDREYTVAILKKHLKERWYGMVICDRYLFSTQVYQMPYLKYDLGRVQECSENDSWLFETNDFPLPELLIYFDVDVETAVRRLKENGKGVDLFEDKQRLEDIKNTYENVVLPYYRKNYDTYSSTSKKMNIVTVNTNNKTVKQTLDEVCEHINNILIRNINYLSSI